MKEIFNNKDKIFIAGSNGMVGSAIKRAIINLNFENNFSPINLLTPTRKELNLLDERSVKNWFYKSCAR